MKITDIKPYIMWAGDAPHQRFSSTLWGGGAGRNWLFVKVETDEGIYGWGEGSLVCQDTTVAEAVNLLAVLIKGHDATAIERHWQVMYLHHRYRGGVIINSAISAIDQALWDIKGKALGVPVYQLLGGAVRTKIRTYTGAGDMDVAGAAIKYGFTGIKTAGWHSDAGVDEREVPGLLHRHIAELRDSLGAHVDIMIDNHGRSRPALAIKQLQAIEELGVLFFEEPVPPENLECLASVRNAGLGTELAAGERWFNRWGFREVIERHLVDVIQPDICHCGGISEMRRIAAQAEVYGIQVAPHNPKGPVATAANVNVCATIPNFLTLEHTYPTPLFDAIQVSPMKMGEGGYELPTAAGLGVDLREDVIAANPYRYRPVIQVFLSDGTPGHP